MLHTSFSGKDILSTPPWRFEDFLSKGGQSSLLKKAISLLVDIEICEVEDACQDDCREFIHRKKFLAKIIIPLLFKCNLSRHK